MIMIVGRGLLVNQDGHGTNSYPISRRCAWYTLDKQNSSLTWDPKNERFVPQVLPARSTKGQFDPSVHGFKGKTYVSLFGQSQSIDSRVIAAANELGGNFKFNIDMNTGIPLGTGGF